MPVLSRLARAIGRPGSGDGPNAPLVRRVFPARPRARRPTCVPTPGPRRLPPPGSGVQARNHRRARPGHPSDERHRGPRRRDWPGEFVLQAPPAEPENPDVRGARVRAASLSERSRGSTEGAAGMKKSAILQLIFSPDPPGR